MDGQNAITDYIGQMIADYSDLLTLEPKNWQAYIYKYNKVLRREPNMLTKEVNYRIKAKGGFYKGIFMSGYWHVLVMRMHG